MSLLVPYTTFFTVDPKSIFLFYDILIISICETILDFNVVFYYIQTAQISFFNNHRGIFNFMNSKTSKLDIEITITLSADHWLAVYSDVCFTLKHFNESGPLRDYLKTFISVLGDNLILKGILTENELLHINNLSTEELFKLTHKSKS